ncbi:Hypothetical predicted protein [Pelobates cultripes]|uniref:Uncharacterized protein n=1 Tax=Pelobates cultripes TaxID=61616 RepID=A0AAD1T5P5_PELCU|nr:Hypothetical predicted protein [Pelobates cultripes]
MQGQEWMKFHGTIKFPKKEKIFCIGSSLIQRPSPVCVPSRLFSRQKEPQRYVMENGVHFQYLQGEKYPRWIRKESKYMNKKEKQTQSQFRVCGASLNLQERPKSQEREAYTKKGQALGRAQTGHFQPGYLKNAQHGTKGPLGGLTFGNNSLYIGNIKTLEDFPNDTRGEKIQTTKLHLYLPKVESEADTARNEESNAEHFITDTNLEDIFEIFNVNLPKLPSQNQSRQTRQKAAITTFNISEHYRGERKWVIARQTNVCPLLDNKNKKENTITINNTSCNKYIQRATCNVGYRLGAYYTDNASEISEHGLKVKALSVSKEEPRVPNTSPVTCRCER